MLVLLRSGRGMNPMSVLAAILVVGGIFGMLRNRTSPLEPDGPVACEPGLDPMCPEAGVRAVSPMMEAQPTGPVVAADAVCRNTGYLCSELETQARIRIQRWKDFEGSVIVYVPEPTFEDRVYARDLQRAAARGIRYWNGQPFPISVVDRQDRGAHFSVRWSQSLGGTQIGVARTQWSPNGGLEVVSLELVTRSPHNPSSVVSTRQVELTAAHEMGHALGLPHSDSPRDVMYPTSTATSLSPQDYRTMQSLYDIADGTEIVR